MRMTRLLAAIALGLALTPVAPAQPGTAGPKVSVTAPQTNSSSKLMYEDIEVMRRLMARNLQAFSTADCQSCHMGKVGAGTPGIPEMPTDVLVGTGSGAVVADFDGDGFLDVLRVHPGMEVKTPAVEGTYLRGHGAVFNVTLPPVAQMVPAG